MIDVPVLVKDALKDGRRLKEYRFKVSQETTDHIVSYDTIATLNVGDDDPYIVYTKGSYRFYTNEGNTAVTVQITRGSVISQYFPAVPGATTTEFFMDLTPGDEVEILSSDYALNLQTVIETDEASWEELFTMDNNYLVAETVSFDERMCSGDTIKFGLCEGTSLEFQYFNKPNIYGKRVEAFVDVQYVDANGDLAWYTIPMGFFYVKKCSRQASTGIMKVVAYNKLQSDYLDAKANQLLLDTLGDGVTTITLYDIQKNLLQGYQIDLREDKTRQTEFTGSLFTTGISSVFQVKKFASADKTSPINIQMMGGAVTTTTPFTFGFSSRVLRWPLDSTKSYTIDLTEDMDALEDRFYSYLSEGVSKSGVRNPAGFMTNVLKTITTTGTMLLPNDFPTLTGWENIWAIILVKPDDNYVWYSKIGKDNARPNCEGTINELSHYVISGYKEMYFVGLGNVSNGTYTPGVPPEGKWYPYNNTPFSFYNNSGQVVTGVYPRITDLDGNYFTTDGVISVYETHLTDADTIKVDASNLPDFTLREIINATYETVCEFGRLDRVTDLFSGVELNNSRLYPATDLYPGVSLYPNGAAYSSNKSTYSKLWADEGNVQKWRYLIITYKGLDGEGNEAEYTLQRTVHADGTQDYNMSDNWLFKNLTWTEVQVGEYADAMVAKMQSVTWFPFEMWCPGLPYLETGDEIEVSIGQSTYKTYVLQRQLKGIQNLQDTYINGTLDIF